MTYVFDASAAVKWFATDEPGADEAARLLIEADEVWLPENCVCEVLDWVLRRGGPDALPAAYRWLSSAAHVAALDAALVGEASLVAVETGCRFYDALAPALARLVGGTLVSADRKAHRGADGVIVVG